MGSHMKKYHMPFFLSSILFLFLFSFNVSAVADANVYYAFNNFSSVYFFDASGNNKTITIQDYPNTISSFSKINNFASTVENTGAGYLNNTDNSGTGEVSYNFWYYFPADTSPADASVAIMSDGHNDAARARGTHVHTDAANKLQITLGGSSDLCSGTNRNVWTATEAIPFNEWVMITILRNGSNIDKIYYNNVEKNTTDLGVGVTLANSANFRILGTHTNCVSSTNNLYYLDEFARYQYLLSEDNISTLYNSGFGFNPFDADAPVQTTSCCSTQIPTQSQIDLDVGSNFLNSQWISYNFDYQLTSYFINFSTNGYVETADFAILALDNTNFRFISFDSEMSQVLTMSGEVCNTIGCENFNHTFFITDTAGPTIIASVNDILMGYEDTETLTFADYFLNYTRKFIQYTDPDGTSLINVSEGFPHNNTCFDASVEGDVGNIISKNKDCDVLVRLIVDDTFVAASSNYFTLKIRGTANLETEGITGILNSFLSIFPPSSELTTSQRMLYLLLGLIVPVLFMAAVLNENINPLARSTAAAAGGIAVFIELIFFTVIGYIPVLVTILICIIGILIFSVSIKNMMSGID